MTFRAQALCHLKNLSFSFDKTKFSCFVPHRRSTTDSLESNRFIACRADVFWRESNGKMPPSWIVKMMKSCGEWKKKMFQGRRRSTYTLPLAPTPLFFQNGGLVFETFKGWFTRAAQTPAKAKGSSHVERKRTHIEIRTGIWVSHDGGRSPPKRHGASIFHLVFAFALHRFTRKKCKRKRKQMENFSFLASVLALRLRRLCKRALTNAGSAA